MKPMIELTQEIHSRLALKGKSLSQRMLRCALWPFSAQGDARVTAIFPIVNARESEEQYHRFVITADDSLRAERAALLRMWT
jgi:hypothetical protein